MKRIVILWICAVLLVPAAAQEAEPRDVRFFLSYIPNVQFSPLYVAVENGYFAAEGIALQIEHGDENIGVEQIALNDIPFGMISGEQVILARAGARPVVYVYEWFQSFPVGLVVPSTTDADEVTDLVGQTVGVPGRFGASYIGLNALLFANGLSEADIDLREVGFGAPDIVCAGSVSATTVYINNEPLEIQRRAAAGECGDITSVQVFPLADYGDLVSNGIVTNEAVLANDPDLVRAVIRAFDHGLQDTANNPARAYLLSEAYVEGLPLTEDLRAALETAADAQEAFLAAEPDAEAVAASRDALAESLAADFDARDIQQFQILLATIDLWTADEVLGVSEAETWQRTQEVLLEMRLLTEAIELEAAYTNAFLTDPE